MPEYQLTDRDIVIRVADGANIPKDPENVDREAYDAWIAAGGVPDPYVPPAQPRTILSQDLMVQFTVDDATRIQAAISGNSQFWLLWSAMQAQRDPMIVTRDRFRAGWAALSEVLGPARMAKIATAFDVTIT